MDKTAEAIMDLQRIYQDFNFDGECEYLFGLVFLILRQLYLLSRISRYLGSDCEAWENDL